jgi:hypothetical protein
MKLRHIRTVTIQTGKPKIRAAITRISAAAEQAVHGKITAEFFDR